MVKKIILAVIAVACAASTLFGAALFHYKAVIFKVNGESVGVCSLDKLTSALEEEALAKYRGIEGIGDYLAVETDLTPITNCNLLQYFTMHDVTINSKVTIADKEALASHIADLNKGRSDGTPCKIVLRGGSYAVKKGKSSSKIDLGKIANAVELGKPISLEDALASDNDYAQKTRLVDQANNLLRYQLRYKECSFSPQPEEIIFSKSGVSVDVDLFTQRVVSGLKDTYDSIGDPIQLRNHSGELMEVSGGTWGREIDAEKETVAVADYLAKLDKSVHTPNFRLDCGSIKDTFVEISIADQHVWFVKEGSLAKESDCVTGKAGVHDTPKGVYYIMERMNGKTLRGDGYSTWVNKWMRLTYSGIGLHDASWRSSFGGEIYKTNGSHGCINLPSEFAAYLLDSVETGMPVIIY